MSNMSYCRFQNTLSDMRDCVENIHAALDDSPNGHAEKCARALLVKLCHDLVEELADLERPEDLGTDKDPDASGECPYCGQLFRPEFGCEDCEEEEVA